MVLRRAEFNYRTTRGSVWECMCDCGNIHYASRQTLVRGCTRSCGCLSKEMDAKRMLNLKKYWDKKRDNDEKD